MYLRLCIALCVPYYSSSICTSVGQLLEKLLLKRSFVMRWRTSNAFFQYFTHVESS